MIEDQNFSLEEFVQQELSIASPMKRLVASIIDGIIILVPLVIIFTVIFAVMLSPTLLESNNPRNEMAFAGAAYFTFIVIFFSGILPWIYFAYFESSGRQASPGKMAMKIYVGNAEGERISFINALGRNAAKSLSGMFMYIGYIMIFFTKNNQALHDMMAGTMVFSREK